MSMWQSSRSNVIKALLIAGVASGCDASGGVLIGPTGGSNSGTGGSVSGGDSGTAATNSGGGPAAGGGGAGGSPTGGAAATGGAPTGGAPPCQPGAQIGTTSSGNFFAMSYPQLSPFYVFNNGWSAASVSSLTNAGQLENISAYETCTPGTISWSTTYNWTGANNTVKGYPAAVLGWHNYGTKGWVNSSTVTGLPKAISALGSVKCSWAFDVSGGASQNISFDIWVHNGTCSSSAITGTSTPSDEIMIWLYSSGGVVPIGGKTSTVNVSGSSWDLYSGSGNGFQVHSFVRPSSTSAVTNLDVLAFLNNLNLGSKCLSSIEAGTEVFTGSGTLKTNSYTCTVQ